MKTSFPAQFNHQYEQHCKHLKLKGLQPKTIDAYSRAIRRIGHFFDFQLDHLTQDQLLDYFHDLLDRLSWSAVKLDLYGLKFFYTHVLNKPWINVQLIKPPKALYSMGLRLSEGLALEVGDIDASRMRVHIRDAKGNKDRLVPLPASTLQVLRQFWSVHKHPKFLFPSRKRGLKNAHLATTPMDRGGVQVAMAAVVQSMHLKKRFHVIPCVIAMRLTY